MLFQGQSALVGSDRAATRGVYASLLVCNGVRDVRQATDGGDTFNKLRAYAPDFVLLDFDLPNDTLAALHQIRRGAPSPISRVPVLVVTALVTPGRVRAKRDAGVNELLVKPVTSGRLLTRLHAMLSDARDFVEAPSYVGPDRRRAHSFAYGGPRRRAADRDDFLDVDFA